MSSSGCMMLMRAESGLLMTFNEGNNAPAIPVGPKVGSGGVKEGV